MQESEFIQLSHTKVDNTKYGRYTGIQGERKKDALLRSTSAWCTKLLKPSLTRLRPQDDPAASLNNVNRQGTRNIVSYSAATTSSYVAMGSPFIL